VSLISEAWQLCNIKSTGNKGVFSTDQKSAKEIIILVFILQ
jgi:hypothetical protein